MMGDEMAGVNGRFVELLLEQVSRDELLKYDLST